MPECGGCTKKVKFNARDSKAQMVVANVYEADKWNRVEHWHRTCYEEAGSPYGEASTDKLR